VIEWSGQRCVVLKLVSSTSYIRNEGESMPVDLTDWCSGNDGDPYSGGVLCSDTG
jgi:hypothetical protein